MHFWWYCLQICIMTSQRLAWAVLTRCSNIRFRVKGNKMVACPLSGERSWCSHIQESNEIPCFFIYLVCESPFSFPSLWATLYQGLYEYLGEEESGGDEGRVLHCKIYKCFHPSWLIFETFLCLLCTLTLWHNSFVPHTSVAFQFSDESQSCLCSAWYQTITALTWRQNGINTAFFWSKLSKPYQFLFFVCLPVIRTYQCSCLSGTSAFSHEKKAWDLRCVLCYCRHK